MRVKHPHEDVQTLLVVRDLEFGLKRGIRIDTRRELPEAGEFRCTAPHDVDLPPVNFGCGTRDNGSGRQ